MLGVAKLNGPAINVFGPNGGPSSSSNGESNHRRELNRQSADQEDDGDGPSNPSAGRIIWFFSDFFYI